MKKLNADKYKPQIMKSKLTPQRIKVINKIRRETIKRANAELIKEMQQEIQGRKNKRQPKSQKTQKQSELINGGNEKKPRTRRNSRGHSGTSSQRQQQQNLHQNSISQSHLSQGLRVESKTQQNSLRPHRNPSKTVTFDSSKNELYVGETMYEFMGGGDEDGRMPYADPNEDSEDDGQRRRSKRNRKNMKEIQTIEKQEEEQEEDDDEYSEEEKPKKQNKNKNRKRTGPKNKNRQKVQEKQEEHPEKEQKGQESVESQDQINEDILSQTVPKFTTQQVIAIDSNEQSSKETPQLLTQQKQESHRNKIISTKSQKKGKIPNLNYDPNADQNRIKKIQLPVDEKNTQNQSKEEEKTLEKDVGTESRKSTPDNKGKKSTPEKVEATSGRMMTRGREKSLLQSSKQK